jgi:hypothetical protein
MPVNRILKFAACRAMRELQSQEPLTEEEYKRLEKMAEICPLEGEHFDEVSWVYPLRLPSEPKIRILDEQAHIVSVAVLYQRNQWVGLIGDEEMNQLCLQYPGGLIFAVGEITKRTKEGRDYLNLRPRGWMIIPLAEPKILERKGKERKK